MTAIVVYTGFKGELTIGQLSNPDIKENLDWFIAKYEKDYLSKVLGKTLYDAFMAGLSADPIVTKWTTLKTSVTNALYYYVYFRYQNDQVTKTVGAGEVKPAVLNAQNAAVLAKNAWAWNQMVAETKSILDMLEIDIVDYPHLDQEYCKYWEFTKTINELNI